MREAAVLGWAQTPHAREATGETPQSMVFDVVTRALASCEMTIRDMDVVIDAGSDLLDGRSTSNRAMIDASGAHFKEEVKVAGDGLVAAIYALMRVTSGYASTALVVAYGKSSESSVRGQTAALSDPFFLRPLAVDALAAGALQARAYMYEYGVGPDAAARVAVKNRESGTRNPFAQMRSSVTLEEVTSSLELVSPIRELEACPVTDGACAVVIADRQTSRTAAVRPAWISGVGYGADPFSPGARALYRVQSAARSAEKAYAMAGISDPLRELGVLEICEFYAYQELMLYEALGLCGEGEAELLLESGATGPGGGTAVNPSGGVLCANPLVATGLVRLAEAAAQVSGRAGDVQVEGVEKALAHSSGGLAMQSAAVMVLES